VTTTAPAEQVEQVQRIAAAILDKKGEDVVALDVRGLVSFADSFILATGTSDRHVKTLADAVTERARELGLESRGSEGYDDGRWVLIDLGDVVVHLFQREVREHYDLERLWGDAPALAVGE
jgi:ribosome-associated protein